MRKFIVPLIMVCATLTAPALSHALEITVDDFMGVAIYEEKESFLGVALKSDWKGFYNEGTLRATDYNIKGFEGELFFGVPTTAVSKEEWHISGAKYQTNDMSLWGINTGVMVGWAFPLSVSKDAKVAVTPLFGYRWRFLRFTRNNFNILNMVTIAETVDEDFNIHSLETGGKLSFFFKDYELFVRPMFGFVLYNAATNSALGTVKGDGGYLLFLDGGINFNISENFIIGFEAKAELQRLEGGTKDNVIWPDNSFDVYGGKIKFIYRF
ncbi:MAG: hypothetical protein ABIJ27_02590 [Candidatus Omnitrophota bacterium]